MKKSKCEKCNSEKVIEKLKITDLGHANEKHNLSIHIQTTDRAFFNKSVKSEISAKVCCGCGAIELSVDNPEELWIAYSQKER